LCYIPRVPLPRVQPIIPVSSKEPFDDPACLFEFKYDGFRALLYVQRGSGRFLSRNNNHLRRFDALARDLVDEIGRNDAIMDGELIATDETGRPMFIDLIRRARTAVYVAFDLLWLRYI
jgi:bifunctional non-homologous end joining protein LigD